MRRALHPDRRHLLAAVGLDRGGAGGLGPHTAVLFRLRCDPGRLGSGGHHLFRGLHRV